MPFTANFSRQFYEKLGDDVVKELVDWNNHVDLAYRLELREQNESNFQRFKATLRAEIAEMGGALRSEMAEVQSVLRVEMADMEGKLRIEIAEMGAALRTEMADMGGKLRTEMADMGGTVRTEIAAMGGALRAQMAEMRADLIKWMFLFWAGTALTVIGVMAAIVR